MHSAHVATSISSPNESSLAFKSRFRENLSITSTSGDASHGINPQARHDVAKTERKRSRFRQSTSHLSVVRESLFRHLPTRTARPSVIAKQEHLEARKRAQQYRRMKQQRRERELDRRAHGQEGIM